MGSNRAKVSSSTLMVGLMKGTLKMILKMEKDLNCYQTVLNSKETSGMASKREKAPFSGRTAKFTTANGFKERKVGVGCGKVPMATLTLASGRMERLRDSESPLLKVETVMRASLKIAFEMGLAHSVMKMETHMWASFAKTAPTGWDSITLQGEIITRESFRMV